MQWLPQVFKHRLFDWESSELKIKALSAEIIEYEQGNDFTCVKKQIKNYEYTRIHSDPWLNNLHVVSVTSIYSTLYMFK